MTILLVIEPSCLDGGEVDVGVANLVEAVSYTHLDVYKRQIVDHDGDVIWIVEGGRTTIKCRIIEVPPRRGDLPNELRKVVPIFLVAGAAAFCRKIILIPPLQLSLWRQRQLAGFPAADQITANGDESLAALRPERRDDVGGPRTRCV